MNLSSERALAEQILDLMPNDEETLALRLGVPRDVVASICTTLHRQKRLKLDRSWDTPRHWRKGAKA